MFKFLSRPQVFTNFVFLLPMYLAYTFNDQLVFYITVLVIVVSIIHHSFHKRVYPQWFFLRKNIPGRELLFAILDYVCAFALISVFAYKFLKYNTNMYFTYIIVLLLFISALFLLGPKYVGFLKRLSVTQTHSTWHILCGLMATIVLVLVY